MDVVNNVIAAMQEDLTPQQLQKLAAVLRIQMARESASDGELVPSSDGWIPALRLFLATKRLSNCAEGTLEQYERAVRMFFDQVRKPLKEISTNDLRGYLALYQERRRVSVGYINTLRLYFNSFFGWCAVEGLIPSNPAARLDRIKVPQAIKRPFTPEEIARIRDSCQTYRDRALIEVLYATGCRIGEICSLDISSADLQNREIRVWGQKGKAERVVYLTEEAVYHLRKYLLSRGDQEPALFVSLRAPARRITKGGVESMLRGIGQAIGIHCHPHKFRRTILTEAARRGMPIQEVQRMAGHKKIDTTMMYVSVSDGSVKASYSRFIA